MIFPNVEITIPTISIKNGFPTLGSPQSKGKSNIIIHYYYETESK